MASPNWRGIELRKLADRTEGERVPRFHPLTGDRYLADPETWEFEDPSTWVAKPWPLLGVTVEGEGTPEFWKVAHSTVQQGVIEGWITVENPQRVFQPGGPPHDPWRAVHTFEHIDGLTLHTLTGDVKYEVYGKRGQPGKYSPDGVLSKVEDCGNPDHEVEWFYNLRAVAGLKGKEVRASDFVFNRALGRGHQWAVEINASVSPYVNSALIVALYRRGSATDAATRDYDDFAALEGDAQIAELVSGTNANYARKVLIDATPVITVDDTNERVDIDFPDQTWTALGAGGTAITDFGTGFDNDTTAGTDSNIVPWTWHAFSVTPDGSDVTAVLPTGGFFRAQ